MLIIDKNGIVQCTNNLSELPVVSKIASPTIHSFQQMENNPLWNNNTWEITVTRTPGNLHTTIRYKNQVITTIENKKWEWDSEF